MVSQVFGRAELLTELLTVVAHSASGDAPRPRDNALVGATRQCSGTRAVTIEVRPRTLRRFGVRWIDSHPGSKGAFIDG